MLNTSSPTGRRSPPVAPPLPSPLTAQQANCWEFQHNYQAPGYKLQQKTRTSTSVFIISGTASIQNSWKTPTTVACSELAEFAAMAAAGTVMSWD